MDENDFMEDVRKKVASTLGIPTSVYTNLARAAKVATQAIMRLTKALNISVEAIKESKNSGVPIEIFLEMAKRGISVHLYNNLRWFGIPTRIVHLATRHKNPLVRKKNQKRILKLIYGK